MIHSDTIYSMYSQIQNRKLFSVRNVCFGIIKYTYMNIFINILYIMGTCKPFTRVTQSGM